MIPQSIKDLWNSFPGLLKALIKWVATGVGLCALAYLINCAAIRVIKENIKEPWFAEDAIKQLGDSVVGSYVYDSFYMGREENKKDGTPKDPTEHSVRIYASKNQKVILYLRKLQYENGKKDKPRKIEILVNGKPIENKKFTKVADNVEQIPLTDILPEARDRTEYQFEKNMIVIGFRDPEQNTKNHVFLEAQILTIGNPELPKVVDDK